MGNTNRRRGHNFERELVREAEGQGLNAARAFNSQGTSLGEAEEVDVKIDEWRIDCKRRKNVASYLEIADGADVKAFREDYGDPQIILPFDTFLTLIGEDESKEQKEKLNKIKDILDE